MKKYNNLLYSNIHTILIAIVNGAKIKKHTVFAAAYTIKLLWPLHAHQLLQAK